MVQISVLKVSIHCEGCKKKLKKVLHKVQGVHTIDIDSIQNRVTVTGDVDGDSLVRQLLKYGKHSELLTEKNHSSSSAAAAAHAETKAEEGTDPLNGGEVRAEKSDAAVAESGVYDSGGVLPESPLTAEHQPVYTMSYSAVHPSTSYAYYQAPPEMSSSYGDASYPPPPTSYTREYYSSESYYGSVEPEAPPEGSYDMFSEENPNACNLM